MVIFDVGLYSTGNGKVPYHESHLPWISRVSPSNKNPPLDNLESKTLIMLAINVKMSLTLARSVLSHWLL